MFFFSLSFLSSVSVLDGFDGDGNNDDVDLYDFFKGAPSFMISFRETSPPFRANLIKISILFFEPFRRD